MNNITISVDLQVKTCTHGHVYAVPHWVMHWICPMCAQREHDNRERDLRAVHDANARLGRVISALRGALSRRRKECAK